MATENLYALSAQARQRHAAAEHREAGYAGKNQWTVLHDGHGVLTVTAKSAASAIWTAAKHWGEDPRKAAFHQNCKVMRVK